MTTAANARNRVLVVVDRAIVDVRAVPASVLSAEARADELHVVIPALTSRMGWLTDDDTAAHENAELRLQVILKRLHEQGIRASGAIGDESPITAIHDALVEFPADAIILTVHGDNHQHWREKGLAEKIRRRYPQPVTEVIVGSDGTASTTADVVSDS